MVTPMTYEEFFAHPHSIPTSKAEAEVARDLLSEIEGAAPGFGMSRFMNAQAVRSALMAATNAPDHARKNAHRSVIRKLNTLSESLASQV